MDDVTLVYIPKSPAVPSVNVSPEDWDDHETRISDLEDGYDLGDLNDVTLTSIAAGQVIQRNAGNTGWENVEPVGGVSTVEEDGTPVNSADVTVMDFADGITVSETSAGEVEVEVAFGGTGSATTASRSDHTHSAAVQDILTGTATGNISSGTRTLSSATLGTLTSGVVYDLEVLAFVRVRNNVNSGTINLLLRVGTDGSYPQRSRNVQNVGGVPVDQLITFIGTFTGAGSGLALSWQVQYSSGDASDIRDWEVRYTFRPRR